MSTIAAISTPAGNGGIGIIRISGYKSFEIIKNIFKTKNELEIKTHSICFGHIINPKTNEIIDEVLVSFFKGPNSYTKEDIVEINCHGGMVVINNILNIVLENGADIAEPGEFTKRAFLNGRIDLSQAEAVIDIINSKTSKEAKASVSQLEGNLSRKLSSVREKIMNLLVDIEASIDYPEYDIEEVTNTKSICELNEIYEDLSRLEKSFENGKILKDGINTVILGRPNSGKSSLLNALLREERAIVTEIEGTTRDTIEEYINIQGVPLKIIDTAGIRETEDVVEKIGVDKAKKIAEDADLIIAIFDSSKELAKEDEEILEFIKNKKALILLNKTDLHNNVLANNNKIKELNKDVLEISALNLTGIEELEEKILEMFNLNEIEIGSDILITNSRHKNLISKAIKNVEEAKKTIINNMPVDIIAINIKEVLESIGEITGDNVSEDLIKSIFSKFCLGK